MKNTRLFTNILLAATLAFTVVACGSVEVEPIASIAVWLIDNTSEHQVTIEKSNSNGTHTVDPLPDGLYMLLNNIDRHSSPYKWVDSVQFTFDSTYSIKHYYYYDDNDSLIFIPAEHNVLDAKSWTTETDMGYSTMWYEITTADYDNAVRASSSK